MHFHSLLRDAFINAVTFQVALEGVLIGQRPLPRRAVPVIPAADASGRGGARLGLSDYRTQTAFSGYFKNLAFYRRPLTLLEALAMSSLPPSSKKELASVETKQRVKAAETRKAEEVKKATASAAEAAAGPAVYANLVRRSCPVAFWPMDESNGLECADRVQHDFIPPQTGEAAAVSAVAAAAGIEVSRTFQGDRSVVNQTQSGKNKVGPLICEAIHRAGIVLGEPGPMSHTDRPGFRAALFQGGAMRSSEGALCDQMPGFTSTLDMRSGKKHHEQQLVLSTGGNYVSGRGTSGVQTAVTQLLDFTFEMWIRRTDPAAGGSGSGWQASSRDQVIHSRAETLLSLDSEARPMSGALWWRLLAAEGRLDIAIEGEARPVGPCPSATNGGRELRDLDWHHVAVSRTSSPDEVSY